MLVLIVATGATVRLTGSGLGCEHWPGCQPGDPFPAQGYHSDVEFSNRVVAFLTVVTTLGLAIGALRTTGLGRGTKILAAVVFAGTLAQAPLGAITVYYHLNPWLVISTCCCRSPCSGSACSCCSRRRGSSAAATARCRRSRGPGARCCWRRPAFSSSPGRSRPRPASSRGAAATPACAGSARSSPRSRSTSAPSRRSGSSSSCWRCGPGGNRARYPWLIRGCGGLLAILALQMTIGEIQYRTYGTVSWYVVLVHVALAASPLRLDGRSRRTAVAAAGSSGPHVNSVR